MGSGFPNRQQLRIEWTHDPRGFHHVHLYFTTNPSRNSCDSHLRHSMEKIETTTMNLKACFSEDDLRDLLGSVAAPGSLAAFRDGLQTRHGNVIRSRYDVSSKEIPFSCDEIPWYSLGKRPIDPEIGPTRTLAYASGAYFVQDAGSLLALALCKADELHGSPLLICDLCAAPGAKASALLEMTERSGGFLLANEVIRSRIPALNSNLSRTGSNRYAISSLDPQDLADQLDGVFDMVLVDAPCSGQAMLSRGKQNRSAFSKQQVEHSALRQNRILDAALKLVKTGGQLVYSTCTFAEAENESQIERLLKQAVVEPVQNPKLKDYETETGCYRLWPHEHQCAGSFASSLRVTKPTANNDYRKKDKPINVSDIPLHDWYSGDFAEYRFHRSKVSLFGWPNHAPQWVERIAVGGPEIAFRTGQTWKPAHAGALRSLTNLEPIQTEALNADLANQYLQGNTINVDLVGWASASYNGRPLGWLKGVNGKAKNHLPTHSRSNGRLIS